jgi:hypothetical protein
MTGKNPEFNFLYAFSNGSNSLVEIKRLDKPADAPPGEVYAWLVIEDTKIFKLTFESMTSGEPEYRKFLEGELFFDSTKANLTFSDKKFELNVEKNPEMFKVIISEYLRGK